MSARHLILHNFWLKFTSIALATVIWLAIYHSIHTDSVTTQPEYIPVPVTIKTATNDSRVFRVSPTDAVVIAVGESASLRGASKKDIHVIVDLTHFEHKGPVQEKLRVEAPEVIKVLAVIPSMITVEQISP